MSDTACRPTSFGPSDATSRKPAPRRSRDAKEIEVNAGLQIVNPSAASENGPEGIVGRAASIADAFRAWQAEGVTEVMCRLEPPSVAVVGEIAEAARIVRG